MRDYEVIERWDWNDSWHGAQGALRSRRDAWLLEFFGSYEKMPPYLWRVDFVQKAGGAKAIVVHTFASHGEKGGRYYTYVRGYDVNGHPDTLRVPAANEPKEFPAEEFPDFKDYSVYQHA